MLIPSPALLPLLLLAGLVQDTTPPRPAEVDLQAALQRVEELETGAGADSPAHADALGELGDLLMTRGAFAEARPLLERSLAIRETALGPDDPAVARSLDALGRLLEKLGDYSGAKEHHLRALDIRQAAHGYLHIDVVTSLNNLAVVLWQLGELDTARTLCEQAIELNGALLPDGRADAGTLVNTLANVLNALGDLHAARREFERAVEIHESNHGPHSRQTATALNGLAAVRYALGDFSGARRHFERALTIFESSLGPEHPHVAACLDNIAQTFQAEGDLAAARPLFERSVAILQLTLGPDHPSLANGLNNLSLLIRALGDLDEARRMGERALAIRERAFGPDHIMVANSLSNLGTVHVEQGRAAEALPMFLRALEIVEATTGPGHPARAQIRDNIAHVHRKLGDLAASREAHERAVADREQLLGPDHPLVGQSLANLALVLSQLGETAAALQLHERALDIRLAAFGPDHAEVAHSRMVLGELLLGLGEAERALGVMSRGGTDDDQLLRTMASLTEGESYLYLANRRRHREAALSAALITGEQRVAYGMVLGHKGQVARLTLQTREQLRGTLDPETLALGEALSQVAARLSREALVTDVEDRAAHAAALEALRTERDQLERRLRRRAPGGVAAAATVDAVIDALPAGAAFVDLFVHRSWQPGSADGTRRAGVLSAAHLSAWVLRAGERDVRYVDLGLVAPVEQALAAHLQGIVGDGGVRGRSPGRRPTPDPTTSALRALVWEPLLPALGGAETVFVSPDGALGKLPFETLRDDTGRFLVEDRAFIYVSDGSALVGLGVDHLSSDRSLLAVGGVDYERAASAATSSSGLLAGAAAGSGPVVGAASPSGATRSHELSRAFRDDWAPLPGTLAEAQAIVAEHGQASPGDRRTILTGADVTEAGLRVEMSRHAILHLATHGFFRPEGLPSLWEEARDAVDHGAALDDRGGADLGEATDASRRLTGLHPGLLSGLVLAGATRPREAARGDDDGYLTASEVTLLDLSAVDLVVLSACETGLGRAQSGEGLLGLRRAFHMAGADTVISSLWSVPDESTSQLMQSFYAKLLSAGMGRHEALRSAQLELLEENRRRHGDGLPSTWGAFVLSGEWR